MAKWLRQNVRGALTVSVGQRNSATDLVDQQLLFVGSEAGKLLAFRELVRTGLQPPVLVFVDTKVSLFGYAIRKIIICTNFFFCWRLPNFYFKMFLILFPLT